MYKQVFSFIPMNEKNEISQNQYFYNPYISFDGLQSTLHYLNYELPIKNHNLVKLNREKYLVPVDHLLSKQEYKAFRDNVEKGDPFTQSLSDPDINALCKIVARYHSDELIYVVSPIKVMKKQFAGTDRELERNLNFVSDKDFANICLNALSNSNDSQRKKKNNSKNRQMEYER